MSIHMSIHMSIPCPYTCRYTCRHTGALASFVAIGVRDLSGTLVGVLSFQTALRSRMKALSGYPFAGGLVTKRDKSTDWMGPDGQRLPRIFWECSGELCEGGVEFACALGQSGPMCAQCSDGWTRIAGACRQCFDDWRDWLVAIFGIAAVLCIWIALNSLSAGTFDALDVALQFVQILNIVQSFHIPWPEHLALLTSFCSIANFDLDFVSPSCLFRWNFWYSHHMTVLLPPITAAIMAARVSLFGLSRDHAIASSLQFLVIVYNGLVTRVLGVVMCRELVDGSAILMSHPDGKMHYCVKPWPIDTVHKYVHGHVYGHVYRNV